MNLKIGTSKQQAAILSVSQISRQTKIKAQKVVGKLIQEMKTQISPQQIKQLEVLLQNYGTQIELTSEELFFCKQFGLIRKE